MRYLITGATGLIGKSLVKHLIATTDSELVLPVRDVAKAQLSFGDSERVCYVQHDFSDTKPLDVEGDVDYIVHGACPTDSRFMTEHPVETINCIVNGTRTMLEFAREKNVKSMVYLSSIEVYGTITDDTVPVTEDIQGYVNPLSTRSSYPIGKRMAETMCVSYCKEYGVPVKIARLTQTFGPGVDINHDNRVFAQFARCVRDGKDIVLYTEGKTKRMYLHVYDAVSAILCLLNKGESGHAYNVANESTYCSVREMAEFFRDNFNDNISVRIENSNVAIYPHDTYLQLDTRVICSLGWEPQYVLRDMCEVII